MWVKWDSKNTKGVGGWANLFTLTDSITSGDNGVFWVQHDEQNKHFEFALHTSSRTFIQSTTEPKEDIWYHLALVYDGSLSSKNMKLYVNGVEESNQSKTGNIRVFPTASRLFMGRWAFKNDQRRFNGSLDEISVWNTALSKKKINDIMNSPESITGYAYNATGLLAYYNFQTKNSLDLTGNGNNGYVAPNVKFIDSETGSLPVELVNFQIINKNNMPLITWSTATEINNDYFIIEKSFDGINGQEIARIQGSGNSNMLKTYILADEAFEKSQNQVYYRLIQVDFDGQTHSYPWDVYNSSNSMESITMKVFPNPSNGNFNLQIQGLTENSTYQINIFDMTGRAQYSEEIISTNSFIIENINPENKLEKGFYMVEVRDGNNRQTQKISIL